MIKREENIEIAANENKPKVKNDIVKSESEKKPPSTKKAKENLLSEGKLKKDKEFLKTTTKDEFFYHPEEGLGDFANDSYIKCINIALTVDEPNEVVKRIKCNLCKFGAPSNDILIDHFKKFHEVMERILCDQCKYKAPGNLELGVHVKAIHEKPELTFPCKVCDEVFHEIPSLQDHILGTHNLAVSILLKSFESMLGS